MLGSFAILVATLTASINAFSVDARGLSYLDRRVGPAAGETNLTTPSQSNGWVILRNVEYCRPFAVTLDPEGLTAKGRPFNVTLEEWEDSSADGSRKLIRTIATESTNLTISFFNDVPVNTPFRFVFTTANSSGGNLYTTIPPLDGQSCDQSLLMLPFDPASVDNATQLDGTRQQNTYSSPTYPTSDARPRAGASKAASGQQGFVGPVAFVLAAAGFAVGL